LKGSSKKSGTYINILTVLVTTCIWICTIVGTVFFDRYRAPNV
jgi:hypothetical protein